MMEHFYQNIQGWFDFQDVYSRMVREARDGAYFVEVGSWRGRSTAYMAVEIVNSGKKILFDAVDTWAGSRDTAGDPAVKAGTLMDEFLSNMKPVIQIVNPVRTESTIAATYYHDGSLDFVFLDSSHEEAPTRRELVAWLPKIRPGGWIGGHDYGNSGVKPAVESVIGVGMVETPGSSWLWNKLVE